MAKEATVTGGERLIAQGRAEGEEKGEAKGQANALLKLLRAKFPGAVDATVEARVLAADASTLSAWLERVLFADDLAGVFEEG